MVYWIQWIHHSYYAWTVCNLHCVLLVKGNLGYKIWLKKKKKLSFFLSWQTHALLHWAQSATVTELFNVSNDHCDKYSWLSWVKHISVEFGEVTTEAFLWATIIYVWTITLWVSELNAALIPRLKSQNIALLVIPSAHIQVPGQIKSSQQPLVRECSDSHLHVWRRHYWKG